MGVKGSVWEQMIFLGPENSLQTGTWYNRVPRKTIPHHSLASLPVPPLIPRHLSADRSIPYQIEPHLLNPSNKTEPNSIQPSRVPLLLSLPPLFLLVFSNIWRILEDEFVYGIGTQVGDSGSGFMNFYGNHTKILVLSISCPNLYHSKFKVVSPIMKRAGNLISWAKTEGI